MDQSFCFIAVFVLIIAALLFFVVTCLGGKGVKHLNVEHYRVKYLEITNQLKQGEPSSYHMTILNADKLVDQALRERGIRGETMGERMKNSASLFSDRNGIWTAHKMRNTIAHETNANISYNDARYALASYKKALQDLGAI